MKTVIDVLKKEARDIERSMGCLQREIDYKEEELTLQKERLSNYKQRLEDIESHIQSLEDDKNKTITFDSGSFIIRQATINAGESVLPLQSCCCKK